MIFYFSNDSSLLIRYLDIFLQVVWDPLKDRAQFLYRTLEKVGFSSHNYQELLDLYNKQVNSYFQNDTELFNSIPTGIEEKILREVGCQWLNKVDESSINIGKTTNYNRWDILGPSKQELHIAGIFPMTGRKYVARELVPGYYS